MVHEVVDEEVEGDGGVSVSAFLSEVLRSQ